MVTKKIVAICLISVVAVGLLLYFATRTTPTPTPDSDPNPNPNLNSNQNQNQNQNQNPSSGTDDGTDSNANPTIMCTWPDKQGKYQSKKIEIEKESGSVKILTQNDTCNYSAVYEADSSDKSVRISVVAYKSELVHTPAQGTAKIFVIPFRQKQAAQNVQPDIPVPGCQSPNNNKAYSVKGNELVFISNVPPSSTPSPVQISKLKTQHPFIAEAVRMLNQYNFVTFTYDPATKQTAKTTKTINETYVPNLTRHVPSQTPPNGVAVVVQGATKTQNFIAPNCHQSSGQQDPNKDILCAVNELVLCVYAIPMWDAIDSQQKFQDCGIKVGSENIVGVGMPGSDKQICDGVLASPEIPEEVKKLLRTAKQPSGKPASPKKTPPKGKISVNIVAENSTLAAFGSLAEARTVVPTGALDFILTYTKNGKREVLSLKFDQLDKKELQDDCKDVVLYPCFATWTEGSNFYRLMQASSDGNKNAFICADEVPKELQQSGLQFVDVGKPGLEIVAGDMLRLNSYRFLNFVQDATPATFVPKSTDINMYPGASPKQPQPLQLPQVGGKTEWLAYVFYNDGDSQLVVLPKDTDALFKRSTKCVCFIPIIRAVQDVYDFTLKGYSFTEVNKELQVIPLEQTDRKSIVDPVMKKGAVEDSPLNELFDVLYQKLIWTFHVVLLVPDPTFGIALRTIQQLDIITKPYSALLDKLQTEQIQTPAGSELKMYYVNKNCTEKSPAVMLDSGNGELRIQPPIHGNMLVGVFQNQDKLTFTQDDIKKVTDMQVIDLARLFGLVVLPPAIITPPVQPAQPVQPANISPEEAKALLGAFVAKPDGIILAYFNKDGNHTEVNVKNYEQISKLFEEKTTIADFYNYVSAFLFFWETKDGGVEFSAFNKKQIEAIKNENRFPDAGKITVFPCVSLEQNGAEIYEVPEMKDPKFKAFYEKTHSAIQFPNCNFPFAAKGVFPFVCQQTLVGVGGKKLSEVFNKCHEFNIPNNDNSDFLKAAFQSINVYDVVVLQSAKGDNSIPLKQTNITASFFNEPNQICCQKMFNTNKINAFAAMLYTNGGGKFFRIFNIYNRASIVLEVFRIAQFIKQIKIVPIAVRPEDVGTFVPPQKALKTVGAVLDQQFCFCQVDLASQEQLAMAHKIDTSEIFESKHASFAADIWPEIKHKNILSKNIKFTEIKFSKEKYTSKTVETEAKQTGVHKIETNDADVAFVLKDNASAFEQIVITKIKRGSPLYIAQFSGEKKMTVVQLGAQMLLSPNALQPNAGLTSALSRKAIEMIGVEQQQQQQIIQPPQPLDKKIGDRLAKFINSDVIRLVEADYGQNFNAEDSYICSPNALFVSKLYPVQDYLLQTRGNLDEEFNKTYLKQIADIGFWKYVQHVKGDGNCFYTAVSFQIVLFACFDYFIGGNPEGILRLVQVLDETSDFSQVQGGKTVQKFINCTFPQLPTSEQIAKMSPEEKRATFYTGVEQKIKMEIVDCPKPVTHPEQEQWKVLLAKGLKSIMDKVTAKSGGGKITKKLVFAEVANAFNHLVYFDSSCVMMLRNIVMKQCFELVFVYDSIISKLKENDPVWLNFMDAFMWMQWVYDLNNRNNKEEFFKSLLIFDKDYVNFGGPAMQTAVWGKLGRIVRITADSIPMIEQFKKLPSAQKNDKMLVRDGAALITMDKDKGIYKTTEIPDINDLKTTVNIEVVCHPGHYYGMLGSVIDD